MDLDKIKQVLYSLHSSEYVEFWKDVHLDCPFKTKEMTKKMINHLISDPSMKSRKLKMVDDTRIAEHGQETREKRREDLLRIQEMESKTGKDPLEVFPKEIWIMLLDKVLPEDKRNFRQIHQTFRNLTQKKLVGEVLLPLILGFKVERFWGILDNPDDHDSDDSDSDDENDDVISQKPVFCPLAQYTELRLVSKSLRNAVDRWFENDLLSSLRSGMKTAQPSRVVSFSLRKMVDYRRLRQMTRRDLTSSSKPQRFFTRSLAITSKPKEYNEPNYETVRSGWLQRFYENIDELLDHIGDQLWYFCLDFGSPYYSDDAPEFSDLYPLFLGWLSKMPNLKWLKVTVTPDQRDFKIYYEIPEESSPPALEHLERLDLDLGEPNRFPLPAFNQILSAYSQVKIMNLLGLKYLLLENSYGFLVNHGNGVTSSLSLEVLNISGCAEPLPGRPKIFSWRGSDEDDSDDEHDDGTRNFDEETFNDITLIESISFTQWPLRQIDADLSYGPMGVYTIFGLLDRLKTLEEIRLSIDEIFIWEDVTFLKLPNLTHFELEFDDPRLGRKKDTNLSFFFCLEFLQHAKKLKSLSWKCDMEEEAWGKLRKDVKRRKQLGEMIEFEGGFFDLNKSNIWRVFPWLDTVKLGLVVWDDRISCKEINSLKKEYRRSGIDFSRKR